MMIIWRARQAGFQDWLSSSWWACLPPIHWLHVHTSKLKSICVYTYMHSSIYLSVAFLIKARSLWQQEFHPVSTLWLTREISSCKLSSSSRVWPWLEESTLPAQREWGAIFIIEILSNQDQSYKWPEVFPIKPDNLLILFLGTTSSPVFFHWNIIPGLLFLAGYNAMTDWIQSINNKVVTGWKKYNPAHYRTLWLLSTW